MEAFNLDHQRQITRKKPQNLVPIFASPSTSGPPKKDASLIDPRTQKDSRVCASKPSLQLPCFKYDSNSREKATSSRILLSDSSSPLSDSYIRDIFHRYCPPFLEIDSIQISADFKFASVSFFPLQFFASEIIVKRCIENISSEQLIVKIAIDNSGDIFHSLQENLENQKSQKQNPQNAPDNFSSHVTLEEGELDETSSTASSQKILHSSAGNSPVETHQKRSSQSNPIGFLFNPPPKQFFPPQSILPMFPQPPSVPSPHIFSSNFVDHPPPVHLYKSKLSFVVPHFKERSPASFYTDTYPSVPQPSFLEKEHFHSRRSTNSRKPSESTNIRRDASDSNSNLNISDSLSAQDRSNSFSTHKPDSVQKKSSLSAAVQMVVRDLIKVCVRDIKTKIVHPLVHDTIKGYVPDKGVDINAKVSSTIAPSAEDGLLKASIHLEEPKSLFSETTAKKLSQTNSYPNHENTIVSNSSFLPNSEKSLLGGIKTESLRNLPKFKRFIPGTSKKHSHREKEFKEKWHRDHGEYRKKKRQRHVDFTSSSSEDENSHTKSIHRRYSPDSSKGKRNSPHFENGTRSSRNSRDIDTTGKLFQNPEAISNESTSFLKDHESQFTSNDKKHRKRLRDFLSSSDSEHDEERLNEFFKRSKSAHLSDLQTESESDFHSYKQRSKKPRLKKKQSSKLWKDISKKNNSSHFQNYQESIAYEHYSDNESFTEGKSSSDSGQHQYYAKKQWSSLKKLTSTKRKSGLNTHDYIEPNVIGAAIPSESEWSAAESEKSESNIRLSFLKLDDEDLKLSCDILHKFGEKHRLSFESGSNLIEITDFSSHSSNHEIPKFLQNKTGCARTEGYYKIPTEFKSTYLIPNQPFHSNILNPINVATQLTSRTTRATNRQLVTTLDIQKKNLSSIGGVLSDRPNVPNPLDSDIFRFNLLKSRKKHVYFARSRIHDWGLFAKEMIAESDMVIEYIGEIVCQTVADHRERAYERLGIGSSYLFRVDEDTIIDATKAGNLARFINHSCEPNCNAKIITVDGQKKIVIYAKRDIQIGEELTYDYKFPIEDNKIPCLCGAKNCRKTLN